LKACFNQLKAYNNKMMSTNKGKLMTNISIDSQFYSGNISVLNADKIDNIRLNINVDAGGEFFQWFHFRLSAHAGQTCKISIENAADAAYAKGWENYQACASYDRQNWFRVPTSYEDGKLIISHDLECDSIYYAYFAPYSSERHRDLIADCLGSPLVRLEIPGRSLDGDEMDLLHIEDKEAGDDTEPKKNCWFLARQHPGETMAEWWMEGFLARLLDPDDAISKALLKKVAFHMVPNMNPDGSKRGHLRTNACGANLNREWKTPTLARSPEVFHIDKRMREIGVDFCLDVHGDEALPYNFIAGAEGIPSNTDKLLDLLDRFQGALVQANPDFQREYGYPRAAPGKSNLTMATGHIAETHGCLAMTLEMPFKDNANDPDELEGWSPVRAMKLGAAALDALYAVVEDLR
jgi:murein tripeptide amidase MpaA